MTNNIATITFTVAALDTEVVGTQRDNAVTVQNFQVPTMLLDATHETDPAAGDSYDFGIRRGTNTTIISTTAGMLRDNRPTQGLRPGFPTKPIAPGQFQFTINQRAGVAADTNVVVHANNPVF